ncbi:hypothetical protein QWZ03_01450 [Chitinimonas viridis]|uniref:Uncharacterized protein n=1 Tax=Chitinimonas viridis TaxID=664880 RepID=A0ABT8AZM6_9NEIS|nr:hypothetical protein [Chitinimonas viridis]MDN3575438.1 hypothetical protein [Chitinimonas viridis]
MSVDPLISLGARKGVDVTPAAGDLIHPLGKNGKPQGLSVNLDPNNKFYRLQVRLGGNEI